MEVNLTLPKWTKDKHIYVLAGMELVAYKLLDQPWKLKTSRCNMCGACCKGCEHLKKNGDKLICDLGSERPFCCCISVPERPDCTEKYDTLL